MRWSDINRNPTPAMLRQFAVIWLVFFLGLAAWRYSQDQHSLAGTLAAIALIVGLGGLARPSWLRGLYVGLMIVTFPIGWTISLLMLLFLYFAIFTPLALLFRIKGRDFLLRQRRGRDSYWLAKSSPADIRSYFRQS